jgi:hypothetical protein
MTKSPSLSLIVRKIYVLAILVLLFSTVLHTQPESSPGIKFPTSFYPILPWDHIDSRDSLKDIAKCNFTMAGIIESTDIYRVEKTELKAIVSLGLNIRRDTLNGQSFSNLSDVEIDRCVKMLIDRITKSDAIIGYFLMDEPSASDFPALGKVVAAVKKYPPGKLAYINLYPNYATLSTLNKTVSQLGTKTYTEYLERFVNEVKPQLISYDNYMVQYSMDLKDKKSALSYYNNLLEVRRVALEHNLPYWNIVSSNQIRNYTTIPSLPNMLFQAYTSMATGFDGISWYKYNQRGYDYSPIDKEQNKTLTWYYLKEVNRQISTLGPIMNQLTSTGVYFTSPAPDESLPLLPGNVVDSVKSDGPMMIGEFINDNGIRYAMIVNLSLDRSVKFTISTKTAQEKIWVISASNNEPLKPVIKSRDMTDHNNGLWLTAGEGVLIKVEH